MVVAVEFAEDVARRAGWAEADLARVALATAEAASNAVEHGGGASSEPAFRVACELDAGTLSVTVADGGGGPSEATLRSAGLPASVYAVGGRGLHIMRQLADRVDVVGGALRLLFQPSA